MQSLALRQGGLPPRVVRPGEAICRLQELPGKRESTNLKTEAVTGDLFCRQRSQQRRRPQRGLTTAKGADADYRCLLQIDASSLIGVEMVPVFSDGVTLQDGCPGQVGGELH